MHLAKLKNIDGVTVRINPMAVSYIEDVPEETELAIINLTDGKRIFVSVSSDRAERAIFGSSTK